MHFVLICYMNASWLFVKFYCWTRCPQASTIKSIKRYVYVCITSTCITLSCHCILCVVCIWHATLPSYTCAIVFLTSGSCFTKPSSDDEYSVTEAKTGSIMHNIIVLFIVLWYIHNIFHAVCINLSMFNLFYFKPITAPATVAGVAAIPGAANIVVRPGFPMHAQQRPPAIEPAHPFGKYVYDRHPLHIYTYACTLTWTNM